MGYNKYATGSLSALPPGKGRAKRRRGRKPRRKKQMIAIPTAVCRKLPASQVVPAQGATGELGSVDSHALLVEPECEKQLLALSAPRWIAGCSGGKGNESRGSMGKPNHECC